MEDHSYCLADGINNIFNVSHNACSVNHFNVSYWIQIDRGDFPVTDMIGDFSIIDPSFQVETYGTHLESDRAFIKNYAIRRCFAEFLSLLPAHLEGVPVSFAVLHQDIPLTREGNFILHCRCFFGGAFSACGSSGIALYPSELRPVDFELSLTVENVRANKNNERKNK